MADLRNRALAAIREGRVTILDARSEPDAVRPSWVSAIVRGHTGRHTVTYRGPAAGWTCSCREAGRCSHIGAVAISTGQPSLAGRSDLTSERTS